MRWHTIGPLSTFFFNRILSLSLFWYSTRKQGRRRKKVRADLRAVTVFDILKVDIKCAVGRFSYDAIHLSFWSKATTTRKKEAKKKSQKQEKRGYKQTHEVKQNEFEMNRKAKQQQTTNGRESQKKNVQREWDCDWTERLSFKLFFWRIQSRLAHTCKENTIVWKSLFGSTFLMLLRRNGKKIERQRVCVCAVAMNVCYQQQEI